MRRKVTSGKWRVTRVAVLLISSFILYHPSLLADPPPTSGQSVPATVDANGNLLPSARNGNPLNLPAATKVNGYGVTHAYRDIFQLASDEVDTRLSGQTAGSTSQNIFSARNDGASTYTRSTVHFAHDVDLSPVSVFNSSGTPLSTATLISPRHVLLAHHVVPANGTTFRFVTRDNVVVTRTLSASTRIGSTDIRIGLLDSDVPSTLSFAKVLTTVPEKLLLSAPILYTDQNQKVYVADVSVIGASITAAQSANATRATFWKTPVSGDSSHPVFAVLDGQMVLLGSFFSSFSIDSLAYSYAAINSTMTSLGGGYQLTVFKAPVREVFGASGASHSTGLVPDPGASAGTQRYLREDSTWAPISANNPSFSGTLIVAEDPIVGGSGLITLNPGAGADGLYIQDHAGNLIFQIDADTGSIKSTSLSASSFVGTDASKVLVSKTAGQMRTDLSLDNVENTADADKSVGTATYLGDPAYIGVSNDDGILNFTNFTTVTFGVGKAALFRAGLGLVIGTDVLEPTGNGSGLTALNASNLSTGTVPIARIPTGTSSTTVPLGNDTRFPASVTGLRKGAGAGSADTAAVAGTDYLAPAAIGTTVQAYDVDLTTWAGITPGTNVGTALGNATNAANGFLQLDANGKSPATVPRQGSFADATVITVNTLTTASQNLNTWTPTTSGVFNVANRNFHIHASGVYTINNTARPIFVLKLGTVTILTINGGNVTATQANCGWQLDAVMTTVTTGASGTVMIHGTLLAKTSAGQGIPNVLIDGNTAVSSAIDLTGTPALALTMNFDANTGTANTCTQQQFSAEVTN